MKDYRISVTDAARNFADCVNRVHYQNVSFVLLKSGIPFARLVPPVPTNCTGRNLSEALAKTSLSREEAKDWRRDLRAARKLLKAPTEKWP